ncbi:MAG: exodeoxyribonuclease VII large subunit, partial [Gammaproteobacteria bacterium]|nr:exodeoxyribonuclease VII large subunit [Gammaproteobacteria bacterium]
RATTIEARLARTHPGYILSQRSQRLDELRSRLTAGTRRVVQSRRVQERHLLARLRAAAPRIGIQRRAEGVVALRQRLGNAALLGLTTTGGRLAVAVAALHAFSPLRTLERGYAIVSDTGTGQVLRHAGQLTVGQTVTARLAAGSFDATVRKIRD